MGAKTAALEQITRHYGRNGQHWIRQFIFGAPLNGSLSRKHLCPMKPEEMESLLGASAIWAQSQARFRGRLARSGYKNAAPLWDEAN